MLVAGPVFGCTLVNVERNAAVVAITAETYSHRLWGLSTSKVHNPISTLDFVFLQGWIMGGIIRFIYFSTHHLLSTSPTALDVNCGPLSDNALDYPNRENFSRPCVLNRFGSHLFKKQASTVRLLQPVTTEIVALPRCAREYSHVVTKNRWLVSPNYYVWFGCTSDLLVCDLAVIPTRRRGTPLLSYTLPIKC